jgi:nucleoside-diphosphate-sugar epimerase
MLTHTRLRALRRLDAERQLRAWGARNRVCVSILRVPGIYGDDRLPLARLRQGTAVLRPEDDVYTNHIHNEDLARICVQALNRGKPNRVYNASDDSELKMGDYFDLVADAFGLARPPRIAPAQAQANVPRELLSFMGESRRLVNARIKRELGVRLMNATVRDALARLRRPP